MFAVINTGGKQYKVSKGDQIVVEKLDVEEGKKLDISEVLLVSDGKETKVGTPFVPGAKVTAKVVSHQRGEKIRVFKMKPKKRYQRTQGHRQSETTLEIVSIA
jgi:large subunit ribosomal protein L21